MRTLIKVLVTLVVLVLLAGIIYAGYELTKKENTIPIGAIPSAGTASSTEATSTQEFVFATTTPDTSSWKTYSSDELGYEIRYPGNLLMNGADALVSFSFPKSPYFHWPLQDDATVTIVATSTCPATLQTGLMASSTTFTLNGYTFTHRQTDDVAAGNRYQEIAYDTSANGVCYHIDFFDHGANGAGLYVDDQTLIDQYNSQHDSDYATVLGIFNGIVKSFTLRNTPDGTPEDQAH